MPYPPQQERDVIPLMHRFLFIANDAHDTKHPISIFIIWYKMWMKREEKEVSFRNPDRMRQFYQNWVAQSYSKNSCSQAKSNNNNKINKRCCRGYEQSQGKNLSVRKWFMNKRSCGWKSNRPGVQYMSPVHDQLCHLRQIPKILSLSVSPLWLEWDTHGNCKGHTQTCRSLRALNKYLVSIMVFFKKRDQNAHVVHVSICAGQGRAYWMDGSTAVW